MVDFWGAMKSLLLAALLAVCTEPAYAQDQPTPTLRTGTQLVLVPVSVRTKAGEPVFTLTAKDFVVTDDGVPQTVRLEEDSDALPLALVVVVEAGDTPESKFKDYDGLHKMLDGLVGSAEHKVSVVAFDSEAAVIQPWTDNTAKAENALGLIETGDGGAATLDALALATGLLQKQPPNFRRAILLISETVDRGSHVKLDAALRVVDDSNTVIYALGYSSTRAATKHEAGQMFSSNEAGPPGGCMGKPATEDLEGYAVDPPTNTKAQGASANNKAVQAFDCLSLLAPPLRLAKMAFLAAENGFKANVPETAAKLTGGEYFKVENAKSLDQGHRGHPESPAEPLLPELHAGQSA